MLDIQKTQLKRAVALIEALGCHLAVITPDGEKFGDLEVKVPTIRSPRNPRRDYSQMQLREKIKAMKIGDVQIFKPTAELPSEAIQGAASGHGCGHFGSGNFITHRLPAGDAQCMRIA